MRSKNIFVLLAAVALVAVPSLAEILFDGENIPNEFAGALRATQNNYTQFGDQVIVSAGGSELDELLVEFDGSNLYIGITGNLEQNGNAFVILLDIDQTPGVGQNVLATEIEPREDEIPPPPDDPCTFVGPPYAVPNMGQGLATDEDGYTIRDATKPGTTLDAGFEPEHAIAVDRYGGEVYVTQYSLYGSSQGTWDDAGTGECGVDIIEQLDYFTTRIYRGHGNGELIDGTNPNNMQVAFDNSNQLGVTDTVVAPVGSGQLGDPRTATSGMEAVISLLDLGYTAEQLPLENLNLKMSVILVSGSGYVSNQILPGINAGTDPTNLDMRPDFTTIDGDQFVSVSLTRNASFTLTPDGQNIVTDFGVANVWASQDTVTGFDDYPGDPIFQGGSELDQLFVTHDTDSIQIGLTGNLETNGNRVILFIDTKEGGESLLVDDQGGGGGAVPGMQGNTLAKAPDETPVYYDYGLEFNTWGGTLYVDLFDLQANTKRYVGANALNSGEGILEGGDNPNDMLVALNNNNELGVGGEEMRDDPPADLEAAAATATTGFEIDLPFADVDITDFGSTVHIFAVLVNGDGSWLSNQSLGPMREDDPLAVPVDNPGDQDIDFSDFTTYFAHAVQITIDCPPVLGDLDYDGDVDNDDLVELMNCYEGPGVAPANLGCSCADLDDDEDVDLIDFATFQANFTG